MILADSLGFYNVDVGLGNSQDTADFQGLKLFAMGDLNNDKMNDIVTVNANQTAFRAWFYEGGEVQTFA